MKSRSCLRALVLGAVWCSLAAACGGSAAESPWPVEPVDTEPGPAGEAAPGEEVIDVDDLPKGDTRDAGAEQGDNEPGDDEG